MTATPAKTAVMAGDAVASAPKKATETLSQFIARVLDQLALSAWLPATALVLLGGFVGAIGAELDGSAHANPATAVAGALDRMAGISLGGAVLAFVAVTVLTMLTQAFAYEAIQVLEGYWGTSWWARQLGAWRCQRHRKKRKSLVRSERELRRAAWRTSQRALRAREAKRSREGLPPVLTEAMIEVLRASVHGRRERVTVDSGERRRALLTEWKDFANPEILRRLNEVERRLKDFPSPKRVLPTMLGNVLRKHEDQMRVPRPGSFVVRHFDGLPFTLQVDHDEARNRLELYCAMVFVLWLASALAILRLWSHPWYGAAAVIVFLISGYLSYRAAIATARWYGTILVAIADQVSSAMQVASAAYETGKIRSPSRTSLCQ